MIISVVQFSTGSVEDIGERGASLVEEALNDKPRIVPANGAVDMGAYERQ